MAFRYSTPLIFPKYGEDAVGENGLLAAGSLTSATDIAGGTIVGTNTAGAVFSSAGFQANKLSAIQFLVGQIPAIATLTKGFTIGFEVSSHIFNYLYAPAVVEYMARLRGANTAWLYRNTGANWQCSYRSGTTDTKFDIRDESLGAFAQVHWTGGSGWQHIYVDGLLVAKGVFADGTNVYEVDIGGDGTVSVPSLLTDTIRNLVIYNRSMILPARLNTIAVFGDSFANQGTYPNNNAAITAATPDGLAEAGIHVGSQVMENSGMAPVMHARLHQNGTGIGGGRILHWAEGGAGVLVASSASTPKTLGQRMTTAVSGRWPKPDVAVFVIGTNDLASTSVANFSAGGTWPTAYQAVINQLPAATLKIVCNLIGRTDVSYVDKINAANNSGIPSLTGVTVVDMFTATGGHNISTDYLQADGVHPNQVGQALFGAKITAAITAAI